MSENANNQTAKVHYTGTLEDGTVFDTSRQRDPFEFEIGTGQVIRGFDEAVAGMAVGETKTVTIVAEDAYGPHFADRVMQVDRDQLAPGLEPEIGMHLQAQGAGDAPPMVVTVTEITEQQITLDANHPLAGKDLTFEIELMELA